MYSFDTIFDLCYSHHSRECEDEDSGITINILFCCKAGTYAGGFDDDHADDADDELVGSYSDEEDEG